jgi:hypothetical protein
VPTQQRKSTTSSDKTDRTDRTDKTEMSSASSEAVADIPEKTADVKTTADETAKADASKSVDVEQSATTHPSGQLTSMLTRADAAVGIKNYDSVAGDDTPRTQLELDKEQ